MQTIPFRFARSLMFAIFFCSSIVFFEPAPVEYLLAALLVTLLFCLPLVGRFVSQHRFFCLAASLFIAVNLISVFFSAQSGVGWKYFLVTAYLTLSAVLVVFLFQPDEVEKLLWISTIGIVLTSLVGLAIFLFDGPYKEIVTEFYRLRAFFKDPNVYAAFIVPHIFFLLHVLRQSGRKKVVFILGLLAVLLPGFFLSNSRGGLINIFSGALVFIGVLYHQRRQEVGRFLGKIMAILAVLLLLFTVMLQFDTTFTKTYLARLHLLDIHNLNRLSVQIKGFDIWAGTDFGDDFSFVEGFEQEIMGGEYGASGLAPVPENSLVRWAFGIGTGRWEQVIHFSAHGLFIRVLVENGLLGLVVLLTILYLTLRELFHRCDNGLAIVIGCSLVGIMVQSLVIDTIHWRHFYLLIGLAALLTRENYPGLRKIRDGDPF